MKTYVEPEFEVIESFDDVICTSGTGGSDIDNPIM